MERALSLITFAVFLAFVVLIADSAAQRLGLVELYCHSWGLR